MSLFCELEIPNDITLKSLGDKLNINSARLVERSKSEQWTFKDAQKQYIAIHSLPADLQVKIKQVLYADHSPRYFKRLSELAIGDIYQINILTKVFSVFEIYCENSTPSHKSEAFLNALQHRSVFRLDDEIYDALIPFTAETLEESYQKWKERGLLGLVDISEAHRTTVETRVRVQIKLRMRSLFVYYPGISPTQVLHWLAMSFNASQLPTLEEVDNTLTLWRQAHPADTKATDTKATESKHYDWILTTLPITKGKHAGKILFAITNMLNSQKCITVVKANNTTKPWLINAVLRKGLMQWKKPRTIFIDEQTQTLPISNELSNLGICIFSQAGNQQVIKPIRSTLTTMVAHPQLDNYLTHYAYPHDSMWQLSTEAVDDKLQLSMHSLFRLLEPLLMPAPTHNGFVIIDAEGVSIAGYQYYMEGLEQYEGYSGLVKIDPCDTRLAYLFTGISHQYLGALYR